MCLLLVASNLEECPENASIILLLHETENILYLLPTKLCVIRSHTKPLDNKIKDSLNEVGHNPPPWTQTCFVKDNY